MHFVRKLIARRKPRRVLVVRVRARVRVRVS